MTKGSYATQIQLVWLTNLMERRRFSENNSHCSTRYIQRIYKSSKFIIAASSASCSAHSTQCALVLPTLPNCVSCSDHSTQLCTQFWPLNPNPHPVLPTQPNCAPCSTHSTQLCILFWPLNPTVHPVLPTQPNRAPCSAHSTQLCILFCPLNN